MFWGLIMEPNKRYTQVVEKPFHISQAALDTATGDNEPCQVMVVVDGKNFLVCTLQKNKCLQVSLDLYFKTGNSIAFLTNGKCNVHLTGYLDPEFEDEPSDEEESEEEQMPKLVPIKNKRKLENANEPTASKKAKQEKKTAKKAATESSNDEDDTEDEEDDTLQKLLDGEDIETDENDESFKTNSSGQASDDDEDESDEEEEAEEEEEEAEEDDDEDDEAETTLDTSKEESKVDMSKLTKSQKKRLRKKQKQQEKASKEEPKVNGVEKGKKDKSEPQLKADKKKAKEETKKEAPAAEKKEKKSLSGGVQIEDLKVGSGPVAKPGKVVMVYYEGRLKQNNKMFDNCAKGPGFAFRLGAKEVISGWDIGVSGMKVGGKRKIICPPAMAYGAKGSPPVIPPNSTLVFEVELKNVK